MQTAVDDVPTGGVAHRAVLAFHEAVSNRLKDPAYQRLIPALDAGAPRRPDSRAVVADALGVYRTNYSSVLTGARPCRLDTVWKWMRLAEELGLGTMILTVQGENATVEFADAAAPVV